MTTKPYRFVEYRCAAQTKKGTCGRLMAYVFRDGATGAFTLHSEFGPSRLRSTHNDPLRRGSVSALDCENHGRVPIAHHDMISHLQEAETSGERAIVPVTPSPRAVRPTR